LRSAEFAIRQIENIAESSLDPKAYTLARIAVLAAMDASPASAVSSWDASKFGRFPASKI
jgi:hypothetical protein